MNIEENLVTRLSFAGRRPRRLTFQSHLPHQTHDALPVHPVTLTLKAKRHPPAPVKWRSGVLLIYSLHQFFVGITLQAR